MSSTLHGILLHVVFSTKHRKKIIDPSWADELYAYMGGLTKEHKAFVLRSGGVEDHIHLLLKTHPSIAIADTMQFLKANSSRWVNAQKKCSKRFQWQRGYGVFSVSHSQAAVVKRYIGNQRKHHARMSFEEEYLSLLEKHEIEFDPRYVFDEEIID